MAMSAMLLGGPPAVQLPAVFQSPLAGFASHVAEPAKAGLKASSQHQGSQQQPHASNHTYLLKSPTFLLLQLPNPGLA